MSLSAKYATTCISYTSLPFYVRPFPHLSQNYSKQTLYYHVVVFRINGKHYMAQQYPCIYAHEGYIITCTCICFIDLNLHIENLLFH